MWPAIIRTVRRGAPGTLALHSSSDKCSSRKTVTRLLVLHAASRVSRRSSADCIIVLQTIIMLVATTWRNERYRTRSGSDGVQPFNFMGRVNIFLLGFSQARFRLHVATQVESLIRSLPLPVLYHEPPNGWVEAA